LFNYRLYRLDGAGKISGAEWVQAADDEEARAKAQERITSGTCEIWDRHRLVAKIDHMPQ
jgi:hypothetical protein